MEPVQLPGGRAASGPQLIHNIMSVQPMGAGALIYYLRDQVISDKKRAKNKRECEEVDWMKEGF